MSAKTRNRIWGVAQIQEQKNIMDDKTKTENTIKDKSYAKRQHITKLTVKLDETSYLDVNYAIESISVGKKETKIKNKWKPDAVSLPKKNKLIRTVQPDINDYLEDVILPDLTPKPLIFVGYSKNSSMKLNPREFAIQL
jgi:uncharacterized protein YqfB (UPF0267 family)